MVHILLDVGTDHATADSIAMSMTYCGNPEIKAIFLAEAAQTPDKELQRTFEWVAGLMYDELPEPYHSCEGPCPTMEELLRDLDELAKSFPEHTHDRRFFSLAHVELTGYRAMDLTHGVLRQLHESFKWMKYTAISEKQEQLWHRIQQASTFLLDRWPP